MRILSISLDQTIANPNSSAAERQRQYYREWNTEIIVLESGSEATTELESGIRVHVTGGRNKVVAFLRGWKLACQVADRGLDVVTAQDPLFCGIIGWRAATRARARLIIQDHSGFFARQHFYTVDRLLAPLARRLVRRADRVRTVSARGFRGLVACGVDPRRIDAIPIATNIDRFTDITLPPSAPNVLCIARLEPEKGISILLEAWRTVVSQVTDAKLRIVGDGSKRVALEDIASQMGISGSVEFIGKAEDVRPHIAWAAIAVQPSFFEGWGIAVV
ncbi:MAG: glycosyltransferase, partial [Patescibacteria group bacterium]